jgi:hypothetical protein
MTDKDRMDWLVTNCYYMEHDKKDPDGFWPHNAEPGLHFNPDYTELTLCEYIDQRIRDQK